MIEDKILTSGYIELGTKFNKLLAENKELKDKLDKDRIERSLYRLYYHVIANCVPGKILQRDKDYIEYIAKEIIE
jgi:hypothetical protein